MRVFFASLNAAVALIALWMPDTAAAADAAPGKGTLTVGGRSYNLSYFVAYPSQRDETAMISVLASDRNLPLDRIRAELRKSNNSDDGLSLSQPCLKLTFLPSGELQDCRAWADNSFFSTSGDRLKGELHQSGERVEGKAELAPEGAGQLERRFSLSFNVPLGLDGRAPRVATAPPSQPTVSGKFTGNGKPAKLAFASARWREPFGGKDAWMLIFTEKDHSREQRPDILAGFGNFGSALIISIDTDGSVFGCEVAHSAHAKKPFSSIGRVRVGEFELSDRHVAGKITTDGEELTFDQNWEVDLKFAAPLAPRAQVPAADKQPTAATPSRSSAPAAEPKSSATTKTSLAPMNVRELSLPKDASDVQFKSIVEQLTLKAPGGVQAVAGEFGKRLSEQGWKNQGADLVTASSAILNRKRGDASLTIMIKPAGSGSQITIFAQGLNWDE